MSVKTSANVLKLVSAVSDKSSESALLVFSQLRVIACISEGKIRHEYATYVPAALQR